MTFNPCKYVPGCSLTCFCRLLSSAAAAVKAGSGSSLKRRCYRLMMAFSFYHWVAAATTVLLRVSKKLEERSLLSLPFLSKASVGDSSFVCCYSGMRRVCDFVVLQCAYKTAYNQVNGPPRFMTITRLPLPLLSFLSLFKDTHQGKIFWLFFLVCMFFFFLLAFRTGFLVFLGLQLNFYYKYSLAF